MQVEKIKSYGGGSSNYSAPVVRLEEVTIEQGFIATGVTPDHSTEPLTPGTAEW